VRFANLAAGSSHYPAKESDIMMHDLDLLAQAVWRSHCLGVSYRLPALTAKEVGVLCRLLDNPALGEPVRGAVAVLQ